MKKRVEILEKQLSEEKLKVEAAERKLSQKEAPTTSLTDDVKLKEREKDILQKEVQKITNWSSDTPGLL